MTTRYVGPKTHRDQIHGDVQYDPLSVALLDSPAMQRLGRVYQLGYAHLVYRGATHTRLSHVMGAAHVAAHLVEALRRNYEPFARRYLPKGTILPEEFLPARGHTLEQRWDILLHFVRWAALLHDLGHVPFGHTLEDEFDGIYLKHDALDSPRIPFLWHQDALGRYSDIYTILTEENLYPPSFRGVRPEEVCQTVLLISLYKEKHEGLQHIAFRELLEAKSQELLEKNRADQEVVQEFLSHVKDALIRTEGRLFFPYMADIVSNTICADYLDYLRRDPLNAGLDVLRDERVISRFFIGRDARAQFRMALSLEDRRGKRRLDTSTGVMELVRQRYRFAEIIYYHKT